jgi:diguanylate cyclase (GGDEF)-like protein/PAS domain S-box-containing protein
MRNAKQKKKAAAKPKAKRPVARKPAAAKPKTARASASAGSLETLIATWPGPAALVAADGGVRQSNDAARPLLAELALRAGSGGLARLVTALQSDRVARTDTIVVAAKPSPLSFDVCLTPLADKAGVLVLARDTSLAANLRQALADSRSRFKDLVEISSDFAWETDISGAFTFVSPQGALGWSANDLLGREAVSFMADAGTSTPFVTRSPVNQAEVWLKRPDGDLACVAVSALPLSAPDGSWRGARGVWHDMTEMHANAAALADAQTREQLVGYITRTIRDEVEPDAMLRAASSGAARALGAAACRIWDVSRDATLSPAADFGAPTVERIDAPVAAHIRRLQAGSDAPVPDRDDQLEIAGPRGRFLGAVTRFHRQINGVIGLWRHSDDPDWTESDRLVLAKIADQIGIAQEQIANHEALAKQARTDALTGLLNRRGFSRQLDRQAAEAARTGVPGSLVYVDLDNFKAVNDLLGHPAGDAALKALADALRGEVRAGDLVARLGGDEFAMWLSGADHDVAVARAQDILALKESLLPYSASKEKPLGLSVGVAVYMPGDNETTAELLARADQAMYEVKRRGKGTYSVAPDVATFRANAAAVGA